MTDDADQPTAPRRDVLKAAGAVPSGAALVDALGPDPSGGSLPTESLSGRPVDRGADEAADEVFPQGVASGDPTASGAVLWTRIDPDVYRSDAPLTLSVTADRGFDRFGALWSIDTAALPERDYTVKVDLDGNLEPGREYSYQFVYDDVASPVGRCRTLPAEGSTPERLRFGVVTCQHYQNGYYPAFHHLATDDLDYVVHLGDFIYEWGGDSAYDGRDVELPSGRGIAWDLADFRHLYRTYRADRFLKEASARYVTIATWDDHEVVDDRYWDYDADRPRAGDGAHPRNDDASFMTQLVADGIQAWWEYMPVRVRYDPDADHLHDRLRLYRSFRFGDLLDLVVTDQRLFRSQPDSDPTVDLSASEIDSPGDADLDHTMLGARQREWFADAVTDDGATWTVWANEVLNMHLDTTFRGERLTDNGDAWDGYEAERRLLMRYLQREGVDNFVALTGDLHTALAGYLQLDYDGAVDPAERVGVELMTPAVTSTNIREAEDALDDPFVRQLAKGVLLERNPHIEFFDSSHHGYAVVEFTPEACEYTAYAVDKTVDSAAASRRELAAFRVPAGDPRLERR